MQESDIETISKLQARFMRARVIFFAQTLSVLGIAVVGWFVSPMVSTVGSTGAAMPLWALVFFLAIGAIVARRLLLNWDRLHNIVVLKGVDGLLTALQTNTILLAAAAELIILAGFASSVLGGDRGDILRALVIAAIVLAVNVPRYSVWETIVIKLEDSLK
jgi:hypothetical protein